MKIKRNVRGGVTLLLALALALCMALPLLANNQKVVDEAGLFTESERAEIQAALEEAIDTLGIDLAVVTINDARGYGSRDFADNYYEDNGYGFGDNHSGMLLLINMQQRELWITNEGSAMTTYGDKEIDAILDAVYDYVADGDYAGGALAFVKHTLRIGYNAAHTGGGFFSRPQRFFEKVSLGIIDSKVFLYLIVGCIILAAGIIGIMLLIHNGSSPKAVSAHNYYQQGGVRRTHTADYFVTSTLTKRPIPKDNNSGGGGTRMSGGGVHTSSSGRSHGGGGRKF